jgi:hypothetical protein
MRELVTVEAERLEPQRLDQKLLVLRDELVQCLA